MKKTLLVLPAALALWLLSAPAVVARDVTPEPASNVKTVEFTGESVGRKMKYNIAVPAKYDQSTDRYPVLYLLHGYSSNYTAWARLGAGNYARALDLIVVMPDVGNSWYVNWAKSEDGQKNDWEDFVIKDLIGHIDSTYRTIAKREGRAINGLSMGGYGGLVLGLRHPELFCSIGSESGAVAWAKGYGERIKDGKEFPRRERPLSAQPDPRIGIEGFNSQVERSPKGKMFVTVEDCASHDPFQLVLKIPHDKLPHICIDCGTEDRLLQGSQEFMKVLMDNKIPFTYAQSPGEHKPPYWAREVGHAMAIQYVVIQRNLAESRKAAADEAKTK
jgi:S-formylglutathione hydrolase FrmB